METIDTQTVTQNVEQSLNNLFRNGWGDVLKSVLIALLLLAVCLIVKRVVLKLVGRSLEKSSHIEKSFHTFIRSLLNIALWFVTIMVVADSFGINASSLLTLVGVAGLAISLAIKDTLANLAGGLTILGTQPFKVGDYVEIGTTGGTVLEIGMVYTTLNTVDNRRILVPNSIVADAQVTNFSAEPLRRVDLVVSASYDASVTQVKHTVQAILEAHEKVLSDPEPFVRLSKYGDSAIDYTIRAWCANEDYWQVHYDVLEQIKMAFDQERISIPYPQVDVHLLQK